MIPVIQEDHEIHWVIELDNKAYQDSQKVMGVMDQMKHDIQATKDVGHEKEMLI